MTDNLDNEIWEVYQTIPMHSSNPEDHIKPLRELMAEQLKQERNKAIDIYKQALHMLNDYANTGLADREYRNSLSDLIYKIKSELTAHGGKTAINYANIQTENAALKAMIGDVIASYEQYGELPSDIIDSAKKLLNKQPQSESDKTE